MNKKYILGIDCGTTLVKVMIVDRNADPVISISSEIEILSPGEGMYELDPEKLWDNVYELMSRPFINNQISLEEIASIGITNQRESVVLWNKNTGKPYGNIILWLDKRAASLTGRMSEILGIETVKRVGIYTIPNTSAMILNWILKNDDTIISEVEKGNVLFGNINSWILWKLTGGKVHATDVANMSVTQLQNALEIDYDQGVLDTLQIDRSMLPEIKGAGCVFGYTDEQLQLGRIPISGMLGDQMAATLGQGCIEQGMVKVTYGTGCFCVMNNRNEYKIPEYSLFTPVLWGDRTDPTYGIEGFFEVYGDRYDNEVLENIAFQTLEIIKNMEKMTNRKINVVRVDGGMAKNDHLCQFQSDILGIPVERPAVNEATVMGAVFNAGLSIGFWDSLTEIASLWKLGKRFVPKITLFERKKLYSEWLYNRSNS